MGKLGTCLEALIGLWSKHKVWRKHIARSHPKHIRQLGQSTGNAACSFKCATKVHAFMRVVQVHGGEACRIKDCAEVLRNLLAQPSGVDDQVLYAAALQALHGPLHEGLAANRQQRFRHGVGQRTHALAAAGG